MASKVCNIETSSAILSANLVFNGGWNKLIQKLRSSRAWSPDRDQTMAVEQLSELSIYEVEEN